MFRIDFIFSYWIFAWYLLYMARITIYSPKLILMIAVVEGLFSYMLLKAANTATRIYMIIIATCIKIIPLISLWREPIRQRDIWVSMLLFMIYNVWLGIQGETMLSVYKKIQVLLEKNTNELPFMYVLSRLNGRT